MTRDAVILGGARTPMRRFLGDFARISAIELGTVAAQGALERAGVRPDDVQHVVIGNAQQTSIDAVYGARHVALKAGVPESVPALTVNRLCGSGIESIVIVSRMIQAGELEVGLAGGMENMVRRARRIPHEGRDIAGFPGGGAHRLVLRLHDVGHVGQPRAPVWHQPRSAG